MSARLSADNLTVSSGDVPLAKPSGAIGLVVAPMEPSSTEPDWSREVKPFWAWDPARSLLASIRAYERGGAICRRVAVLRHRFWSVVTGAEISLGSRIAGGLLIPHPNGIVIHPDAVIGPNCLLFQQVTLGTVRTASGAPVLGGHVDVGAGAKVLGDVTVGANARIGANAVVLSDVAAGSTVVGIPARPIESRSYGEAETAGARLKPRRSRVLNSRA